MSVVWVAGVNCTLGGADKNLDYLEVVHVLIRRQDPSGPAIIKLGKRLRAAIRQLGYPTKNALRNWYREHKRRGDLPKGSHRTPKYSKVQRQVAVDHFVHHGRCIAFTRKALGYPSRCVLRSWIYEQHPEVRRRSVGRSHAAPSSRR